MIAELIFLISPVFFAGLSFIFILKYSKLEKLNLPLDCGIEIKRKRLFGKNKTVKGPLFMGLFTMIYGFITFQFLKTNLGFILPNLWVLTSFLFIGFAYAFGELPNSFIKRQLGIPPGKSSNNKAYKSIFKLVDTFDSLFAVGLVYYLLFNISIKVIITAVLIGGFIHLITDKLMVRLKLKKQINKDKICQWNRKIVKT